MTDITNSTPVNTLSVMLKCLGGRLDIYRGSRADSSLQHLHQAAARSANRLKNRFASRTSRPVDNPPPRVACHSSNGQKMCFPGVAAASQRPFIYQQIERSNHIVAFSQHTQIIRSSAGLRLLLI
jgi:hypothetical protein